MACCNGLENITSISIVPRLSSCRWKPLHLSGVKSKQNNVYPPIKSSSFKLHPLSSEALFTPILSYSARSSRLTILFSKFGRNPLAGVCTPLTRRARKLQLKCSKIKRVQSIVAIQCIGFRKSYNNLSG